MGADWGQRETSPTRALHGDTALILFFRPVMGDPAADTAEPPPLRGGAKGFATVVTGPACQLGPTAFGSGRLAGLVVSFGAARPADRHLLPRYPVVAAGTGPEGLVTHVTLVLELRRRLELYDRPSPDAAVLQHDNASADALGVEKAIQVKCHVTVLSAGLICRQVFVTVQQELESSNRLPGRRAFDQDGGRRNNRIRPGRTRPIESCNPVCNSCTACYSRHKAEAASWSTASMPPSA